MDKQGILLCAKYSVAPNFFGYCGPDKNLNLVDHIRENIADSEVASILKEFETLYPYLQLIAHDNKIPDIFSEKVVEAYWVGNSLLKNVNNIDYADFLKEKFLFNNKLTEKNYFQIKSKVMLYKLLPHHSFHVFNIFKRTGHDTSPHTLNTMDECRIGWGEIVQVSTLSFLRKRAIVPQSGKSRRHWIPHQVRDDTILLKTKPLVIKNNKLQLGDPILKETKLDYKGKSFLKNLKVGDWVSFHWSFACDILSLRQVKNLEYYTKESINFFNH